MANVILKSGLFDLLQAPPASPDLPLDYAMALEGLDAAVHGTARALQLSSTLIRVGWTAPWWSGDTGNFEVQLSGSGIRPISNLTNLMNAIDDGLATGGINALTATRDGVEILRLSLAPSAWTLTSGAQSVTLTGALPTKFQTIFALESLLGRVDSMDLMTTTERAAYFSDLAAYGVTGLTIANHGATVFSLTETATAVTLAVSGVTVSVTGSFPTNFGAIASVLWEAQTQMDTTGSVDLATLHGIGVTALTITNPAGGVVLQATDLSNAVMHYSYAGRVYAEWVGADAGPWSDNVVGAGGNTASLLTGLGGDDVFYAYAGDDAILGGDGHDFIFSGEGNDLVNGGAGFDRAVFVNTANLHVDLLVTAGQVTGQGTDTLVAIEAVTTAGGNDNLHGNAGANALNGMAGNDLLEGDSGDDTLIGGAGNDTLVGMRGNDLMSGGNGADVFRFVSQNGVITPGRDVITDFDFAMDRLGFAPNGPGSPWSGMSKAAFIANFVHLVGDDIVISLSADQSITLDGHYTSLAGFGAALNLL